MAPLQQCSDNLLPVAVSALPKVPLSAPVQEVFSSIQGEGIHVGKRQVFVRFAHCHLSCAYCDTPMTSKDGRCHIERVPGSGKKERIDNPLTVDILVSVIQSLQSEVKHHSISFTGGEPLLYHRFLNALFPKLSDKSRIYLETSGTQPDFLAPVLPWVDTIAMDIKLPSATAEAPQFDAHRQFLAVALRRPETEVFIKLVFGPRTTDAEIEAVKQIVGDHPLPLILQPVTDRYDNRVHMTPRDMLNIEQRFSSRFNDVRLIPQTHKMLQVL